MKKKRQQLKVGRLDVPFIVDQTRTPLDFKQLDSEKMDMCANHQRCGVCGGRIRRGPFAFIGPLIAHSRACFADPWMHPSCAERAMVQCPFLRGDRGWRGAEAQANPLIKPYSAGMYLSLADGGTSHKDPTTKHWHFEAVGELRHVQIDPAAFTATQEPVHG